MGQRRALRPDRAGDHWREPRALQLLWLLANRLQQMTGAGGFGGLS